MRLWRFWWQTITLSSQNNPPRFVELIMLLLAAVMLLGWVLDGSWPFLVLSSSYVLGSAASIWVREWIGTHQPNRSARLFQATALLGLTGMLVWLSLQTLSHPWL